MIGPVLREGPAPAVGAALALVAGIWLGAWSRWGICGSLLLIAVAGGALFLARLREVSTLPSKLAFFAFWGGLGFLSGAVRIATPARVADAVFRALPDDPDRRDRLEGRLVDFWSGAPPRARGRLRAERILLRGIWRAFPADVTVFLSGSIPPAADKGDRVRIVGHLSKEDLPASERDLPLPDPRYRLSVKSALRIEQRSRTLFSLLTLPNRALVAAIPAPGSRGEGFERDVRGPLAALLLGRTAELDRGMVARYRRGGLYHLLVVSGLHVALAACLVLGLLRLFRVEGRWRDALLLASVLLFVLIGGANPPAVRAGLFFAVLIASRLLERPIPGWQAIGLSALMLFLAAPEQIFSIGTVLTFTAVAGIALFARPLRARLPARPGWLWDALAAALAAEAATAGVLFWRFNLVAAGAWLTAPLSVPLSGALIALGALLLAVFAVGLDPVFLSGLFAAGSRLLEWLAERAAGVAFLRPTPPLTAVVAVGSLLLAAALAPRRLRAAAAASAGLLYAALALRPGPPGPERGFSVEALDVGQGDALLLRWGRRSLLVDGGGPFDLGALEFGRTRLLPKLLDRGVTRLDAVLATHPHPDHVLGLFSVLEELPVSVLWLSAGQDEGGLYARLEAAARERGVPVSRLIAGRRLTIDGLAIHVLHSGGRRRKTDATNNQSVVVVLERDGRRVLLTGDIGAQTERELTALGLVPRVDLLKIPHHGSRGSTTPELLAASAPRAALLSCGRANRFGHPHPETLRTLSAARVRLLRTDWSSDVRVELRPHGMRLRVRGVV